MAFTMYHTQQEPDNIVRTGYSQAVGSTGSAGGEGGTGWYVDLSSQAIYWTGHSGTVSQFEIDALQYPGWHSAMGRTVDEIRRGQTIIHPRLMSTIDSATIKKKSVIWQKIKPLSWSSYLPFIALGMVIACYIFALGLLIARQQ